MPTDYKGLSSSEAKARLAENGPNALPEKPPPSNIKVFLDQIKSPLVYILIAAGVVTFALGEIPDTVIIILAVFVNTILGFVQESRAGKALHALKMLVHPSAKVIRDGKQIEIDVNNVVPGDICVLSQGDKIPADGKLLDSNRFQAEEAILTGESVPIIKNKGDKVFMGTIVGSGNAYMEVARTGGETEIGKIALSVQEPEEDTPLKRQLNSFSKQLTTLVLGLIVVVFLIGFAKKLPLVEIFTTSVALAVSSIPEGLLVGLTVVLAIGMQRILKRKGLVRNLVSAETLGGVTTICIDKTGTLTEGKMKMVKHFGDKKGLIKQSILANDFDDPIVVAIYDWAKRYSKKPRMLLKKHRRLDSIPFVSTERYFASLNRDGNKNTIFVNGAPEYLLDWSNISGAEKEKVLAKIDSLTKKGMRLMGMAKKSVATSKTSLNKKDVKSGLEWVGFLVFSDPIRKGVKEALEKTMSAGIKLIVITGDYSQTAVSVMSQLGLKVNDEDVVLGSKLAKLSPSELSKRLKGEVGVRLFARTTPQQKLKIVEALKKNSEVVAMMGDGVNDAPALQRADIGIVVESATDVAKETADLVLLDSNFATIVAAIEEGRGIFSNIRKIILYLMSDAFEEIFAVVGAIILSFPLPVTAVQILWINLVSDGFPNLALTIDPHANKLMEMPPRHSKEKVVATWMKELILIVSAVGGAIALGLFAYFYTSTSNLTLSQSITFAALGVNSLVYVFSVRTLREPFWVENPFDNKWLNVSVLGGLVLQIIPFSSEALRGFFGLEMLSISQWGLVFSASIVMFIIIEVLKSIFRHSRTYKKT